MKWTIALLVGALCLANPARAATAAYWAFDTDGQPAGTLIQNNDVHVDVSGHGHDGTARVVTPAGQWIAATINGVGTIAASHVSNRFDVASSSALPTADSSQSFTFETFLRTTANFTGNIFEHRDRSVDDSGCELLFEGQPMQLRLSFSDFTQETITTGPAVNDGQWHHVAVVWDAGARTYSLFVDYTYAGQIDVSGDSRSWNATSTTPDVELSVGGFNWAGWNGNYFSGDLDDIRLSDAVLSPGEFLTRPLVPEPALTEVENVNTTMLTFESVLGIFYGLESATTLSPPDWTPAGLTIAGNGGDMLLFDPTGLSTQKHYRVVVTGP